MWFVEGERPGSRKGGRGRNLRRCTAGASASGVADLEAAIRPRKRVRGGVGTREGAERNIGALVEGDVDSPRRQQVVVRTADVPHELEEVRSMPARCSAEWSGAGVNQPRAGGSRPHESQSARTNRTSCWWAASPHDAAIDADDDKIPSAGGGRRSAASADLLWVAGLGCGGRGGVLHHGRVPRALCVEPRFPPLRVALIDDRPDRERSAQQAGPEPGVPRLVLLAVARRPSNRRNTSWPARERSLPDSPSRW